uniref:Uncharacterized protein n=1 Tax=Vitis vinifera TaxID=29760 RepID=A5AW03_VITVI|nr:hypothetical protein VITISV_020498 [Vitis vinifera]
MDPTHSTRTGIIDHSTRVGIPSGCRHYIRLPPLSTPDVSHSEFCCRLHSTRMYHIRNSTAPPFHPDVSHPEFLRRMGEKSVSTSPVINFVDYSRNQGAPAGHESTETPSGHESNGVVAGNESNGVVAEPCDQNWERINLLFHSHS